MSPVRPGKDGNGMRKSGFTLIELLVVIAIIAILAAILFPVFARAREKARQTTCTSNLKQLALGMLMYVQDYDEKFPGQNIAHYPGGPTAYPNDACCVERNIYIHIIGPYIKNRQLGLCPSGQDDWPSRGATIYGPAGVYTHYKYKHAVCSRGDGVKMSLFAWPSEQIMLNEYRSWHGDLQCGCRQGAEYSTARPFNCAFFDGHVKVIRSGDTLCSKKIGYWDPHWFWYPDLSTNTSDPSVGKDI